MADAHLELVDLSTIEPERVPCAKSIAGIDPYAEAPDWAYAPTLEAMPSDEQILANGHGYKLVAIAKRLS